MEERTVEIQTFRLRPQQAQVRCGELSGFAGAVGGTIDVTAAVVEAVRDLLV